MKHLARLFGFAGLVASVLHMLTLPVDYLTAAPVNGFMLFSAMVGQAAIFIIAMSFAFPDAKWRARID